MTMFQIFILALIQGAAELLPVSSSAHVIVAAKLMGLDPTTPGMTLLLVMLHTGTMFAVICYFWRAWRENFFYLHEAVLGCMQTYHDCHCIDRRSRTLVEGFARKVRHA